MLKLFSRRLDRRSLKRRSISGRSFHVSRQARLEFLERRELLASYTTPEDTVLVVSDPSLATLRVVSPPLHGTVSPTNVGGFAYAPAPNYHGPDRFTYVLATSSNTATGELQEASITVTPVNDRPVAVADEFVTHRNRPLTIGVPGVLKNDKDVDGDALTAKIEKLPENGTLTLNENGSFQYTPAEGYAGPDSFTYRTSDGVVASEAAKVSLSVKALPDARDDQYSVKQDGVLTIAPKGVLANDIALGNFGLVASLEPGDANKPQHGTVELKADGSFTYKPNPGYTGPDSFVYRATDATPTLNPPAGSTTSPLPPPFDVAKVHLYVYASPIIHANDDLFTTQSGAALSIEAPGVLKNDFVLYAAPTTGANNTVSGDPNTVPDTTRPINSPLLAVLLTNPAPAGLTFNANGSFKYQPPADFVGSVTFRYQARLATTTTPSGSAAAADPTTGDRADVAVVTINVHPRPEEPRVVAGDDFYRTSMGTALSLAAPGVLKNDIPVGPPTLAENVNTLPLTFAPVQLAARLLTQPQNGTLRFNADGSFKYEPKADFVGTDTFTYQALIAGASTDPATGASLAGATDITCQVSANALQICPPLPLDNIGIVTIHVTRPEPEPAPIARNDFYTAAANTKLAIRAPGVLANDSPPLQPIPLHNVNLDIANRPIPSLLTAVLVDQPANGKVVLNANGSFEYQANEDFVGVDTFTYQASWQNPVTDSTAATDGPPILSSKATVTIRVVPSLATPDMYTTLQDTPLNIPVPGVLGNDAGGSDEHPLKAAIVSEPLHGKLKLNADGSFRYEPGPRFTGSDLFVYRADTDLGMTTDPAAGESDPNVPRPIIEQQGNVAIVKIFVRAAQSSVQAYPDKYIAAKDTTLTIAKPGVLANDYALVNHRVEASLHEGPAHGTVTVNADGGFTYTPAAGYTGEDRFIYKATDLDGAPGSAPSNTAGTINVSYATVVIHVRGEETPPKFLPGDNLRTTDDGGLQKLPDWATLLAPGNDGKPDFQVSTDKPQLFAVTPTIDATGQLTYAPAPNARGEAKVTVRLKGDAGDANAASATFTIQIDKPFLRHNAEKAQDVTGDKFVAPNDVLEIVNYINAFRSQAVGEGESSSLYYDVDKDNFIAPSDALAVINYLNTLDRDGDTPEGEASAAADLSLLALLADGTFDAAGKRKRS